MIVRRTALVTQPASHLFDVIEAAEHYPRFLPWCVGATIVHRDESSVSAEIAIRLGGVGFTMRTRNAKARPEWMTIRLERGPFRRFDGEWRLTPLSDNGCKVAFSLDYELDRGLVTRLAGPLLERAADSMVDAFVKRALVVPLAASVRADDRTDSPPQGS